MFYMTILHFCTIFGLCFTYHVHDKMSHRCFCASLWILWNTKVVGIIMFLWSWNNIWICVFTLCPSLHTFEFDARAHTHTHTHTLWHVWVLNTMILSCFDDLCLHMSILVELLFKFLFLGFLFNVHCVGTNLLLIKFAIIFCALFCGTFFFVFTNNSNEENHCTTC